jgi:hypothetical protein
MDPKHPEDPWKVIAPSKTGRPNDWCEVVSYLSEEDARLIAAASQPDDVPF